MSRRQVVVAAVLFSGLNAEAVGVAAAQSRAEQAIELLRLALSCPVKPLVEDQMEPVNAHGTYRTFTTTQFDGDSNTFRVVSTVERRLHNRTGNVVTSNTERTVASTAFSAIAAADIVGADSAENPLLGITCKRDGCLKWNAVEIPVCDADAGAKAKLAIEILIGFAGAGEPVRSFELHRHVDLTGPKIGETQNGVLPADCLRMCRANSKCVAFTVTRDDPPSCDLKSALGGFRAEKWSDTGVMDGATVTDVVRKPPHWTHNGSVMTLAASGTKREFFYQIPREGLATVGIKPGTLLFTGHRSGNTYSGTAYVFNKRCGPIAYDVSGEVASDDRGVTMRGQVPLMDSSCRVGSTRDDTLVFTLEDNE
jgi:hypothetical protein